MNVGFYGYVGAALAYSFFTLLLLFNLRDSLQGKLIFLCTFVSACWALTATQIALHNESYLLTYQVFDVLRYITWYVFLVKLFDMALSSAKPSSTGQRYSYQKFVRWALPVSVGFAFLLLLNEVLVAVFALARSICYRDCR